MGFYSSYKAVFDRVRSVLQGVSSIKQVVLGERFKLHTLPLAIVNPGETGISQAEIGSTLQCSIGFDVILVVRSTEPEDWFSDVLAVMGDVVDALLADRTLSGAVKDVKPVTFTPGEIRFTEKLYYGGLVGFEALLFYSPS
jgi:hypothetical protein